MPERCCLWCKDKNNKANHNSVRFLTKTTKAVVYDAKIRIIKQITTDSGKQNIRSSCCLWCKDKNNKANHNYWPSHIRSLTAVVYDAKIRIIKQITTWLWLLIRNFSCCLWCKDKNNKANHNKIKSRNVKGWAVVYDAKIRIIKQITTAKIKRRHVIVLLFMMQR